MPRPRSLKHRVALAFMTLALLLVATQAAVLMLATSQQEGSQIDSIVEQQMRLSLERYALGDVAIQPNRPDMELYSAATDEERHLLPPGLASLSPGKHQIVRKGITYIVQVTPHQNRNFYLVYDVMRHESRQTQIIVALITSLLLTAVLSYALGKGMAARLLKPMESLVGRVGAQGVGPPKPLIEASMEMEVEALAKALESAQHTSWQVLQREREFTGNVSHELRNPLSLIRSSAELLAEDPQLAPKTRQRAYTIIAAADRLARLTRSLLFLARELPTPEPRQVALHAAVTRALEPVRDEAGRKELAIHNLIPETASVMADPDMLDLVLSNLLHNAIRYTLHGSVTIRWDGQRLEVNDTGPGIPPERLPYLFDRFYHGSADEGSTGLGLAIVRRVCDACHWTCSLQSQGGSGSTAHLALQAPSTGSFRTGNLA